MNRKATLVTLIVSQIIYVLFIAAWLLIMGVSVMAISDPNAYDKVWPWLIILFITLYPVGVLTAIIMGWVCYKRRKLRAALIWDAIPLVWIIALAIVVSTMNFS